MSLRRQIIAVREELKNVSLPGALNLIQTYISMKTHPIHVHSLPTMVQIEPTLRCNLRCRMCVRTYWRKRSGDLGFENYQRIVDQFPHLRQLNLTGVGESLLNRDFFRMVEYAKSRKIYVKLFDSGTMLDQR
ncbi:MAG: radical SAM protein, partial [Candidatus Bathyarchaeia archaeon]